MSIRRSSINNPSFINLKRNKNKMYEKYFKTKQRKKVYIYYHHPHLSADTITMGHE